jgi:hypothetical protein
MKKLLAFLPLLAVSAFATPCTSTQYDILSWFAMRSSWSQQYHLAGNANPLYTYRSNRGFYWIKAASGYPWDVNYYDKSYIYQWATEYNWADLSSYKAFNSTTTMPWYGGSCTASSSSNLGYVVNEIWGPTPLSFGGTLPNNALTLTLSYRYSCSSSYNSCRHKETFDFQRPYGLVRWTYYVLQNGQYVQQAQSLFNQLLSGGAPSPYHPCW